MNESYNDFVRILEIRKLEKKKLEDLLSYLDGDGWELQDYLKEQGDNIDLRLNWNKTFVTIHLTDRPSRRNMQRLLLHNNSGKIDPQIVKGLFVKICDYLKKNKIKYGEVYKEG
ncbi:hypothetical protein HZA33_02240 [Candidatus Pacearchaeota archaeon]|nr:hypothetical protein [Candidatus Pacearchaeota archaeon]